MWSTTSSPSRLASLGRHGTSDIRATTVASKTLVFSLKIAKLRVPSQWPLQVFGMVAIRDCVDHNRNIIFDRARDNCQTVTREDPYLKLTGPTRSVVVLDPATFEVDLKVKGTTESEDQWLSFLAVTYRHFSRFDSHLLERDYASKLSELQFQLGSIIYSVEATIEVRITSGSWPHGLRAQFTAGTASIPGAELILLDSGDHGVPVAEIGRRIELSRCVASVEVDGELRVRVKAFLGDKIVVNRVKAFKSRTTGVSNESLRVHFDREISQAQTADEGEISKANTAGKGVGPLGVDFLGCCTFGFNISWSVISSR
ncbi:hypothetical protein SORBI_3006G272000 [Sorghum bicolor]|uniref:DUF6598 domain-containing protein n=1 Tax=Sorghum bicolor TaxID=4558 RepID=A0A1Z5RFP6_SORBI|nr:hypothetical protein SORBI_3006G272000 [Sorghum bicolor]